MILRKNVDVFEEESRGDRRDGMRGSKTQSEGQRMDDWRMRFMCAGATNDLWESSQKEEKKISFGHELFNLLWG